jgi:hypothetical protein
VNDSNRSWVPCKPTVFEIHSILSTSSILNSSNFAKGCAAVNDGQSLDDKISASNMIDLPKTNQVSNVRPGNGCLIHRRKFVLTLTNIFLALKSITNRRN